MKRSDSRKNGSQGTHGVQVRMPVDLHADLKRIAEADDRPVNAQIVHAIRLHVAERESAA